MTRRGYAIRIGGDAEIALALAGGIDKASRATASHTVEAGETEAREKDQARAAAEAVADRWIEGERLKRAVGNHHTSEDYAIMIQNVPTTYRLRPLSVLWAVVGLIVWASVEFMRWEERRWRS